MNEHQLGLLVSVRNVSEARIAGRFDIDIIDLKEPLNGALGRADDSTIREFSEFPQQFSSQQPALLADSPPRMSLALGEMGECRRWLEESPHPAGFTFAKCGMADTRGVHWQSEISSIWSEIARFAAPVAVAYADSDEANSDSAEAILDLAIECQITHLLVDTFGKRGRNSIELLGKARTKRLIARAASANIKTVLAGSLLGKDIPLVRELNANYIGVRGAICNDGRTADVCPQKTEKLATEVRIPVKPNTLSRQSITSGTTSSRKQFSN